MRKNVTGAKTNSSSNVRRAMQAPRPVISQIVFQESVISRITFTNDKKSTRFRSKLPVFISRADCEILALFWSMTLTDFWKIHPGQLVNMEEFSRNQSGCFLGRIWLKIVFLFEISIINFGSIRSLCTVCIHCRLKFRVEFFCRIKFLKC